MGYNYVAISGGPDVSHDINFMAILGHSLAVRLKQFSSRIWSIIAAVIIISVTSSSGSAIVQRRVSSN